MQALKWWFAANTSSEPRISLSLHIFLGIFHQNHRWGGLARDVAAEDAGPSGPILVDLGSVFSSQCDFSTMNQWEEQPFWSFSTGGRWSFCCVREQLSPMKSDSIFSSGVRPGWMLICQGRKRSALIAPCVAEGYERLRWRALFPWLSINVSLCPRDKLPLEEIRWSIEFVPPFGLTIPYLSHLVEFYLGFISY